MPFPIRKVAENCTQCEFRKLRLFCNLGDEALRRFDEMGMHVSFPSRVTLFEEGDRATGVYIVCTGQLKLSTTSQQGRTMILRLAGPGDVLGLSAVLSDLPHEVTAETLEPCQLKNVRRADFMDFLEKFAEVGQKAAQSVAREYREAFLDARRLAISGSASGRLSRLLLDWADSAAHGKAELRFTMALTHEELANMAGTSRETVTRLLNQFERDHLVARHGASIVILNPTQLSQVSE
jgi:CRP/FNR family transcriptional regulator